MLWLAVAVFLLLALISYTPNDPSWSHVSSSMASNGDAVSNLAGRAGAWLADIFYTFLGVGAWALVLIAAYEAWLVWRADSQPIAILRLLGYVFLLIGLTALASLTLPISWFGQGVVGQIVGTGLSSWMTTVGASVFLLLLVLLTATFCFDIHWLAWLKHKAAAQSTIEADTLDVADDTLLADKLPLAKNKKSATTLIKTTQLPLPLTDETNNQEAADNVPTEQTTAENEPILINELSGKEKNKFGNPLSRFLTQIRAKALVKQDTAEPVAADTATVLDETVIAEQMQTAKLDEALYKEAVFKASDKENDEQTTKETVQNPPDSDTTDNHTLITAIPQTVATPVIAENHVTPITSLSENSVAENVAENKAMPEIIPQDLLLPTHDVSPFKENGSQDDDVTFLEDEALSFTSQQATRFSPTPSLQNPVTMAAFEAEPAIFENKIQQDVVQDVFEEIPALPETPANPLDIHNDALFQAKSRAMQTAAYRASLTPVPELSILDLPDKDRKPSYTPEQLKQMAELLEIKLQEFNVKSTVVNAEPGPVVTRFEVDLAAGVKASKVTGISRDLARSLSMASVRVVEVIPGKPYIGIEVPNPTREMVRLIELLDTADYRNPNSHISMAMGKDIAGRPVITDLAKAPHMLVAGTTGSGKSVLVNSMLLSILLKYTPEQLRMILIDPKQLELANYGDIPHLLTPVVTDMTEAASALSWCVSEMERRYMLMSLFKVRKLDEFNKKVMAAEASGQPLLDPLWRPNDSVSVTSPPKLKTLPLIVIVADEFADMIMQVGKQAEELITRLAQKSRAAGIHLILATQRPSVDVITGLIKANIPVRAALRVNSKVDSRTILDAGGAEDMLGNGDMLFLGPGQIEPNRVHGAYVSDSEVNRVCDAWRERGAPDYIDNMFDNFDLTAPSGGGDSGGGIATGDQDAFYDEAVAFVMETRKVSASSIQRKFSIGYNRAARLVDAMEEAGLVSGLGKNGKRELLM